jgi:hypothetical protein
LSSLSATRKASVALLIGAFALSACGGGGTPTAGPSTAAVTTPAPTVAATTPATTEPAAAETDAPATLDPSVDPADDLEIADPYTLDPLDEQIAAIFVNAMKQSVGENANLVQFGFRTATKAGATEAWVIVMAFPGLPIAGDALLDQFASAATSGGGSVEDVTVGGKSAKLLEQGGQSIVIMLDGDELLMIVGTAKKPTLDVAKAIGEAN